FFIPRQLVDEIRDAFGGGGARQHTVHGDAGAGAGFGEAACDGDLRGFGHAVMDHFSGNLHGAFARNENDAAPVAFSHPRQKRPAEADAGHDVDLEETQPVVVGNFFEGLGFEDAEVVDEDVNVAEPADEGGAAFFVAEIAGDAFDAGVGHFGVQFVNGKGDALFRAAIDDDAGAFAGEAFGDGKTDSRR